MKNVLRPSFLGLSLTLFLLPLAVRAHCDTLEGPVVSDARSALRKGDVTPVLKWIGAKDESSIRDAFKRTLAVRSQSTAAAELADTWFFETLVRIHREGEGAPYTGLKTNAPEEPGIAAADRALASGESDALFRETTDILRTQLDARLARTKELQAHAAHSVDAGREYVAAYVDYIHFAERLATIAASASTSSHGGHNH
jgi:Family of unknown function (DUF6448)